MNFLDVAICGVILLSALIGLLRGFLREALSLASWIGAFWLAWVFAPRFAPFIAGLVENDMLRQVASFSGIFILSLLVAALISNLLHRGVRRAGLTGPDRGLGLIFGTLRGAVLLSVVAMLAHLTAIPQENWWKQSLLMGYFEASGFVLIKLLPAEVARRLGYG
ncbi:MAG: CvpA family protein [Gammaproteobacteria bacterium]|jgi:membrane protein required for colicin V production|nr:CvpA family protein [Gammaproteobacteria bacterium]